jgi:toxin FitB
MTTITPTYTKNRTVPVIDTDVASVLQKNRAPAWVHRHVTGARVWLTFVTVAELSKWAEVRSGCS